SPRTGARPRGGSSPRRPWPPREGRRGRDGARPPGPTRPRAGPPCRTEPGAASIASAPGSDSNPPPADGLSRGGAERGQPAPRARDLARVERRGRGGHEELDVRPRLLPAPVAHEERDQGHELAA